MTVTPFAVRGGDRCVLRAQGRNGNAGELKVIENMQGSVKLCITRRRPRSRTIYSWPSPHNVAADGRSHRCLAVQVAEIPKIYTYSAS